MENHGCHRAPVAANSCDVDCRVERIESYIHWVRQRIWIDSHLAGPRERMTMIEQHHRFGMFGIALWSAVGEKRERARYIRRSVEGADGPILETRQLDRKRML